MAKIYGLTAIILLHLFSCGIFKCIYEEDLFNNEELKQILDVNAESFYACENLTVKIIPSNTFLSTLKNLKSLTLRSLQIEEINVDAFRDLETLRSLNLMDNRLKEVPIGSFNHLENLERLFLTGNLLTTIPSGLFKNLKSLKKLDLMKNLINHIDADAFSDLSNLKILLLNQNRLTVLPEGLAEGMKNLDVFWFSFNSIQEFQDVQLSNTVRSFDGSSNALTTFNVNLSHLPISNFRLSNNQLEEFDFAYLGPTVAAVDLSSNRLSHVKNYNRVKSIVILQLQDNKITYFEPLSEPNDCKYISTLDLSTNRLDLASCFGYDNLETLHLRKNKITVIRENSFATCKKMKYLDLSSNNITTLEPNAFNGTSSLKYLVLSNNSLSELNPDSFLGLNSLSYLDLTNNNLKVLSIEVLVRNIPELSALLISGNPFYCNEIEKIIYNVRYYHIDIGTSPSSLIPNCSKP